MFKDLAIGHNIQGIQVPCHSYPFLSIRNEPGSKSVPDDPPAPLRGWSSWIRPRPGSVPLSTMAAPGHEECRATVSWENPQQGKDQRLAPIWHCGITKFTLTAMRFQWKPVPWIGAICARTDMIDPGQNSEPCGRSLEFPPSSALLRRASTYLAVAPD